MVKLTYSEALAYIHSVSWKGSVPGLSRITELCGKMGNPQEKPRFIHVTGTNGKGSSCAMLESILRNAGYKTGLFTSPFVKHFNERMAVCGKSISDEQLAEITGEVKVYADSMTESPTEFELITAIAFRYFEKEKCDIVILEVGMGGRLDSTNVVHNTAVSLITGVALDHTEYLGDTVEKIAAEKAGIIKPGRPVVCGLREENSGAARVIREKAEALGSEFIQVDYGKLKITKADLSGAEFSYGEFKEMRISLLGLYQPENAAKVLETVKVLRKLGYGLSEEAVRKGLSDTVWHARFEKLSENPLIIYDGSHNPEGVTEAVKTVKKYFGEKKVNLLTGVMADKEYRLMAKKLSEIANEVFCVKPDNPRALDAESLAAVYSGFGIKSQNFTDFRKGVLIAKEESLKTGIPLVCLGSLYMYKDFTDALGV